MIPLRLLRYVSGMEGGQERRRVAVGIGELASDLLAGVVSAAKDDAAESECDSADTAEEDDEVGVAHAAARRGGALLANSSSVATPISANFAQHSAGIEPRCRQDLTVWTDLPVAEAILSTSLGTIMSV